MRNGITVTADTSLLGFTKRACNINGTLALHSQQARGILEFKVDSGEQATLIYEGRAEGQAGGAIPAGHPVLVASGGYLVAASSGDAGVIGFAEDTAVTSGSFGDFVVDFRNRSTMTTSEG